MSETDDSATSLESETPNSAAKGSQPKASFAGRLIERLSHARKAIVIIAGIGTVLGGLMGYWNTYQAVKGGAQSPAVGAGANMAANAARMSIVVLPFANLSGDPGQEYFPDAITEDITTELSRIKGSFVIARNTAFTYKGKTVDAKVIGKELGVRYVLQGSVSRSDSGAQVTAQLVDAGTGGVIWSDHMDVKKEQFDNIRREVTGRLAFTLKQEFVAAEVKRAIADHPKNLDAQDFAMQALAILNRAKTTEDFDEAYKLYGRVLELDPQYEPALVRHAAIITGRLVLFPKSFVYPPQLIAEAEKKVTEALALEPNDAMAHYVLATVRALQGRMEEAIAENNSALELDPNFAMANGLKGRLYTFTGRAELAIEPNLRALALSPRESRRFVWMNYIGQAYMLLGKYQDSIEWYETSVAISPFNLEANLNLAAAYAQLGNMDKAVEAKTRALKINSEYKIQRVSISTNPTMLKQREETFLAGLRKAGFGEEKSN